MSKTGEEKERNKIKDRQNRAIDTAREREIERERKLVVWINHVHKQARKEIERGLKKERDRQRQTERQREKEKQTERDRERKIDIQRDSWYSE